MNPLEIVLYSTCIAMLAFWLGYATRRIKDRLNESDDARWKRRRDAAMLRFFRKLDP